MDLGVCSCFTVFFVFFFKRMMHPPTLLASFFLITVKHFMKGKQNEKRKIRHFSVKHSYINKSRKTEVLTLKDGSDTERESGTNGWIRAMEERLRKKRDCVKMNLGQWNVIIQVLIKHVQCKRGTTKRGGEDPAAVSSAALQLINHN